MVLAMNGKEKTMSEWSKVLGIKYSTIHSRIVSGWSIEKSLTTKVKLGNYKKPSIMYRFAELYLERFFGRVKYGDNCWEWVGCLNPGGYGILTIAGNYEYAHRYSYEYFVGSLGKDKCLHHCDNPSCVNPFHLFKGTQKDNMHDAMSKGRHINNISSAKKYCISGHEYTEENTYYQKITGTRTCRECTRIRQRSYYRMKEKID